MAQTILVTGSNSGFGRLIVETLARQGYTVFAGIRAIAERNASAAEELRTLAEREQLTLSVVEIDVTDDASVERAIEMIVGTTGRLDVVVNNAGASSSGPLEAFSSAQIEKQFNTNVFSVLRVNRAAIPQMRKQGSGLLLHIGSVGGRVAAPFLGLYGATKFALEGLSESYRYELAPYGIDVAIIEPGAYPTAIATKRQSAADDERSALYQEARNRFLQVFFTALNSATPPNPQEVADIVAGIIAQPAGKRPSHIVVAPPAQREALQAINETVAQAANAFLGGLDLPAARSVTQETLQE